MPEYSFKHCLNIDEFLPRPWGGGTPQCQDDDAEAVERHLLKFGTVEEIYASPRSFLQGRLEGHGIELHIRRKSDEGTWLQVQLNVNGETKMHICLDMLYPYESKHGPTKVKDKEIWRGAHRHPKTGCMSWQGAGYAFGTERYVDASEHFFPVSVGYGWHGNDCIKTRAGEWHYCDGESDCGKKVWMFKAATFDLTEEGKLEVERDTLELTYVLFNPREGQANDKVYVSVVLNNSMLGWVAPIVRGEAKLTYPDKNLLNKMLDVFVEAKRKVSKERLTHPPHVEAYLEKVYVGPSSVSSLELEDGDGRCRRIACLLQILLNTRAFDMSLLVQVLHGQVDEGSTKRQFTANLFNIVEGTTQSVQNLISELPESLGKYMPYKATVAGCYDLAADLQRLLCTIEDSTLWAKLEPQIGLLLRKKLMMVATWTQVKECEVCDRKPPNLHPMGLAHMPRILLQCETMNPFRLSNAVRVWLASHTEAEYCGRDLFCR